MNAISNSANDFIHEDAGGFGSDSDMNTEEDPPEYYQPISAVPDDNEDLRFSDRQNSHSDEEEEDERDRQLNSLRNPVPNGYLLHCVENGVVSLDLSVEDGDVSEEEEEEEEEERSREESEVAMRRPFRDDESRRNAHLTPENTVRVLEAMRGVSFGGLAPDWVVQIPEDQWIDRLRRIRQTTPATSTVPQ